MTRETIRARLAAATGGPWTFEDRFVSGPDPSDGAEGDDLLAHVYDRDNVTLVAHARQDIPALLAVADAACDLLHEGSDWTRVEELRLRLSDALAALEDLP